METALLGLGSNLGRPDAQLREAVSRLRRMGRVRRVSSIYRTEPVGGVEQPDYLNAVVSLEVELGPRALLSRLQRIEEEMGRVRTVRHGPRVIDLDLLDHGSRILEAPGLCLPHPAMHERAFVLVPLDEIAPQWRHPRLLRTARELLEAAAGSLERIERVGPL